MTRGISSAESSLHSRFLHVKDAGYRYLVTSRETHFVVHFGLYFVELKAPRKK